MMSRNRYKARLKTYLKKLEENSLPTSNDRRHGEYVKYGNTFLSCFGSKECIYLGGSTGENLKVRWSKDGGDADFIFCSGKIAVLVRDLEFRKDMPCFVWVRAKKTDIDPNIELIEGTYLPAERLRRVAPEFFTLLRGIYLMVTRTSDSVPGRNSRVTTIGVESKVGLARTEYRNLDYRVSVPASVRAECKRAALRRDAEFKQYLEKRRETIPYIEKDVEGLETILNFIKETQAPGRKGEKGGPWHHFAHITELALRRRRREFSTEKAGATSCTIASCYEVEDGDENVVVFENDLDECPNYNRGNSSNLPTQQSSSGQGNRIEQIQGMQSIERQGSRWGKSRTIQRVTYEEKTSKDFVPAIKIVGRLPCMEEWKHSIHLWLKEANIEEIYNMDVFIVARFAPVNPSRKDFCLSFTLAEKKMSECLNSTQRKIVLIMKAYLKGVFTNRHKELGKDLKLTTFHMKTIIYRVSDTLDPSLWSEKHILTCVKKILEYLTDSLLKKELLHYFINSNLFCGFEDEDLELLLLCTQDILDDPVGSIKVFLDLDDGKPFEDNLTEEQIVELEELSTDDGLKREIDMVDEAILDFERGFSEAPRDKDGYAPIQKAITALVRLFAEEEAERKLKEANVPEAASQALAGVFGDILANPQSGALAGLVGQFVGSSSRSRSEQRRLFDELRYGMNTYLAKNPR